MRLQCKVLIGHCRLSACFVGQAWRAGCMKHALQGLVRANHARWPLLLKLYALRSTTPLVLMYWKIVLMHPWCTRTSTTAWTLPAVPVHHAHRTWQTSAGASCAQDMANICRCIIRTGHGRHLPCIMRAGHGRHPKLCGAARRGLRCCKPSTLGVRACMLLSSNSGLCPCTAQACVDLLGGRACMRRCLAILTDCVTEHLRMLHTLP